MKEIKKDKDATWLVNIILCVILAFVLCGHMGCVPTKKVQGHDAQYWYEQYLNSRHEMFLWENICHQYYEFKDYDFIEDRKSVV